MSKRALLKNFLINGGDNLMLANNLYKLFGYVDLEEKGYFLKKEIFDFLGIEGPIA